MPSPTTLTDLAKILSLILCCSSLTPGRLKPSFKPLGLFGFGPPCPPGPLFGPALLLEFGILIITSAFLVLLF